MHTEFLEYRDTYDGAQLRSHWAFTQTGVVGDTAVAWIAPARVGAEHMVDHEDRAKSAWIASDAMLHLILEHFGATLEAMVLRQLLCVNLLVETLHELQPRAALRRRGNDLYDGDKKLNVSIATVSPVSGLIHIGVNVVSTNTPVPTIGLADYGIDARTCAATLLARYAAEITAVRRACCKVRAVL